MLSLEKQGHEPVRMRNGVGSVRWAKNRLMRGMENTEISSRMMTGVGRATPCSAHSPALHICSACPGVGVSALCPEGTWLYLSRLHCAQSWDRAVPRKWLFTQDFVIST